MKNKFLIKIISIFLIITHLSLSISAIPTHSKVLSNQNLAPKSQVITLSENELIISSIIKEGIKKNIFSNKNLLQKIIRREENTPKAFIARKFKEMTKLPEDSYSIHIDSREPEDYSEKKDKKHKTLLITVTTPPASTMSPLIIQTFETVFVDMNELILRQEKGDLNQSIILKHIKTIFKGTRDISTGVVKVIRKTWGIFIGALMISMFLTFIPPSYATSVTSQTQIKAEHSVTVKAPSEERKKIETKYANYFIPVLKDLYYGAAYNNPDNKLYKDSIPFKRSTTIDAKHLAKERYEKTVGAINFTLNQQSKFFPDILKIADKYKISPALLFTIRGFEVNGAKAWELEIMDKMKSTISKSTSVGPYQIRIDKMRDILEKLFQSNGKKRIALNAKYPLLEKYTTYEDFLKTGLENYDGKLANALSSNEIISTELVAIFLGNMMQDLRMKLPDIFDGSLNLNNIDIRNDNIKNKWNVFMMAYTYALTEHFSGEDITASDIFIKIKRYMPVIYAWSKSEAKTIQYIQQIIANHLKTGGSLENLSEAFNKNMFTLMNKDEVLANREAEIYKYYVKLGGILLLLIAVGRITYKQYIKEEDINTIERTPQPYRTNKRNRRKKNFNLSAIFDIFNSPVKSLFGFITTIPAFIMNALNKNPINKKSLSNRTKNVEQCLNHFIEKAKNNKESDIDLNIIEIILRNYGFNNINLGNKENKKISIEKLEVIIKAIQSNQTIPDSFRIILQQKTNNALFQQAA